MQCDKRKDRFEFCCICGSRHSGVLAWHRHLVDHHGWDSVNALYLANVIDQQVTQCTVAARLARKMGDHWGEPPLP